MQFGNQKQDVVAQYPEEVRAFKHIHKELPADMNYAEKEACTWENRFYIHTRVTLPLTDIENGLGFGLWVELSKENFKLWYEANTSDDAAYMSLRLPGKLASLWPGFLDTYGLEVIVGAVSVDEKLYIVDVPEDQKMDLTLQASLIRPVSPESIEQQKELVTTWMESEEARSELEKIILDRMEKERST